MFQWPPGKKHFQQLVIQANQILPDELQGRLVCFWRYQQCIVNLPNPQPQVHLQLPVAVGLFFGVRVLFLQGLDRRANIVPVFFERQAHGGIVAGFSDAARFFKLGVPQFFHQFSLVNPACFAIEARLKIGQALRGTRRLDG